jgi:hypothetical protein
MKTFGFAASLIFDRNLYAQFRSITALSLVEVKIIVTFHSIRWNRRYEIQKYGRSRRGLRCKKECVPVSLPVGSKTRDALKTVAAALCGSNRYFLTIILRRDSVKTRLPCALRKVTRTKYIPCGRPTD